MSEWTDTGGDTDNVPAGTVVMWTGDPSDTPDGWTLCDGTNPDGPDSAVPDLRNRFVVGAGDEYSTDDTGGDKEVQLSEEELAQHEHKYGTVGKGSGPIGHRHTGGDYAPNFGESSTTDTAGEGQPHENRPPYYALAYIVRLGGGDNQPYSKCTGCRTHDFVLFTTEQNKRGASMIPTSHNHELSVDISFNQLPAANGVIEA